MEVCGETIHELVVELGLLLDLPEALVLPIAVRVDSAVSSARRTNVSPR